MAASPAAPVLLWFRRDLRLADNAAVRAAADSGAPVIPVFILDDADAQAGVRPIGGAGRWWLDKSLAALDAALQAKGSRLLLRRGPAAEVLTALAQETGARALLHGRLHHAPEAERDAAAAAALQDLGVATETFNTSLLFEPGEVRTGAGGPFKVFTPWWRAARQRLAVGDPLPEPRALPIPGSWPRSDALADWDLHPRKPDWSAGFDWTPGEAAAHARLRAFVRDRLGDYSRGRDRPAEDGSSRLSPHLHWGELSPQQVVRAACAEHAREDATEKFLSELAWRDFNHGLLAAFPHMPSAPLKPAFEHLRWRDAPAELEAWRRGRTGYPIVDAGMRQLWSLGWMHNRVRLITSSFLVKHLLIDWREGERWFWDCLVDADLANNTANWQWIAGSGVDAQPFFRIFNPMAQAAKFDGDGAYVRQWVPELAGLDAKYIHAPWTAPAATLKRAGVTLGATYPKPLVDHPAARARALEALREMRGADS